MSDIFFGNNVDFKGHQILNARIQNLAGDPSGLGAGSKGLMWFDTTAGQDCFKIWNGASATRLRDDWLSGLSPAAGSPLTFSGTQALTGDIALASGSFLFGDGNGKGRALAKSSIPLSGFGAALAAVNFGSQRLTNLGDPVDATDGVNLRTLQASMQGIDQTDPCRVATTAALPAHTFLANIMTASANGALPDIDGVTPQVGDRVLIKNEGSGSHLENGIYVVTAVGDASNPWILTRAADADETSEVEFGLYTLITEGTMWAGSGWRQTTIDPTLNTDPLRFQQFTSAGTYAAGRGLVKVGTTFHFAQSDAYTAYTIPYASDASTISFLGVNSTATRKFIRQVSSGAPAWDTLTADDIPSLDAAKITDGTIALARLPVGLNDCTTGDILYASGTDTWGRLAANGTATVKYLRQVSGGAPTWGQIAASELSGNPVTGTGTSGKLAKFTATGTIGDSLWSDNGTTLSTTAKAGFGTASPTFPVHVITETGVSNSPGILIDSPADVNCYAAIAIQAGSTAVQRRYFEFRDHTGTRTNLMGFNASNGFIAFSSDYTYHLLSVVPGALARINSGGVFDVRINNDDAGSGACGSGGLSVYDGTAGGTSPTNVYGRINASGMQVFNGHYFDAFAPDNVAYTRFCTSATKSYLIGSLGLRLVSLENSIVFSDSGYTDRITFDTSTGAITAASLNGSGTRLVTSIAAGTIGALANGTNGQVLQMVSSAPAWHTLAIADVTGLQTALDLKTDRALMHAPAGLYFDGATPSTRVYATLTGQTIGTGDFSLRVKFRVPTTNPAGYKGVIGLSSSSTSVGVANALAGTINPSGAFYFTIYGASTSDIRAATLNSNLVTNYGGQVVEAVFTRTGTTVAIYLNGQSMPFTESTSGTFPAWSAQVDGAYLLVGARDSSQIFTGPIYAASVFNFALSAADVLDIFIHGIPAKYQWGSVVEGIAGAIVDLDFEHANPSLSTVIADRSNNALHGTIVGGISQTRWIPQLNVGTLVTTAGTLTALLAAKADSTHNHNASAINAGTLDSARIPDLDASKITTGALNASVTIGGKFIGRIRTMTVPVGTTSLALAHGLGTKDLHVMLRNAAGEYGLTSFTAGTTSEVTLYFGSATTEELTAVIIG